VHWRIILKCLFETDSVSLDCIRELRCYRLANVSFCNEHYTLKLELFTVVNFGIMVSVSGKRLD
jgi:hypothetical protein